MRISTTGFGLIACTIMALASGCAETDTSAEPSAPGGSDSGADAGVTYTGSPDVGVEGTGGRDIGGDDAHSDDTGVEDAGSADTGRTDAGSMDGGVSDSGVDDAGLTDAGSTDSGLQDAGSTDAGDDDSGVSDTGVVDAGAEDSGTDDSGTVDAGGDDAGTEDAGTEDAGLEPGLLVRAFVDEVELEDGQGTTSSAITVEGSLAAELAGAAVSYSLNGSRFHAVEAARSTFEFGLTLVTGENTLTVRAVRRSGEEMQVYRTYFGAIGSRAGTYDQECRGPTSAANAAQCQEICEDIGGDYDGSWGNIGGCRNIPGSSSADLDFSDRDAPAPVERATTHDQQCLGSTSAANSAACEEICTDLGGTYDADWGNIGGCRDMPGSAMSDLDFTDGTVYPAPPARDTTHDQQCLGSTSAANVARCEELCEDFGGTYDADWGNIGGCRDMPGSAGDLDFTDGTISPDEASDR